MEHDEKRRQYLEQIHKLHILRFANSDIKENFEGVCAAIDREVDQLLSSSVGYAATSPQGKATGETMKTVTIYTDGACSGNPGPGGWGAILKYKDVTREMSGGEKMTTNNRMELLGVISALQALKEPCAVELWSDSKYVIDALEKGWAVSWRKRGWVKSDKKPALNSDLWEILLNLTQQHEMHYHWVKGHADNPYNNRCDALAVAAREKLI
jgi:ribonuclease HI